MMNHFFKLSFFRTTLVESLKSDTEFILSRFCLSVYFYFGAKLINDSFLWLQIDKNGAEWATAADRVQWIRWVGNLNLW